jgi:hypothetical protein
METVTEQNLAFTLNEFMMDELEINFERNIASYQNLSGCFECCDQFGIVISKCFIATHNETNEYILAEKKRFGASYKDFLDDQQHFHTFQEWKEFVVNELLPIYNIKFLPKIE